MLPIIITFLALFVVFDVIAFRSLVRIHPRHRRLIIAATVIGNLLWPFLPLFNARSDFSRFIRATLGPPWFSWAVFTILYCALLLVLRIVWLPLRKRVTFVRLAHWPSRVFLSLILIGGLVGVYQCLVPLRIEHVPVYVDSLPPEAEGYRIALMGDLHVGMFTRPSRLTKIFTTVNTLRPNVAILAGDSVDDDPYFVPKLLAGANALDRSIPLVAVLGNHEMYGDPLDFIARLRGSRIHLLVNQGTQVGPVWIAGISDYAAQTPSLEPDFTAALAGRPADTFPLLVSHQPKSFDESRRRGLPLTLCAHTHGGQLGFRPLHWSLAGLFLPYHMGLYRRGVSQLYVSTGTGYWLLPFRLGMTPEITLIELHRR